MAERGELEVLGRGLYRRTRGRISEHHSLVEAAARVPHGVICLLSALRFHELTTQSPIEVWLAIDHKGWRPTIAYPPTHIVRFSGASRTMGVEIRILEGFPVPIYSAAKTVADCFKFRNKIGMDVAMEALRDCLAKRKATIDDLWQAAKVCRVTSVMKTYLEIMV